MKTSTKRTIPSLGVTGREIFQAWKALRAFPGEVIEAQCHGEPMPAVAINADGELEVCEHHKTERGGYLSTVRKPTEQEVANVHEAIDRGWLQIEGRKRYGALGVHPFADAGRRVRVYHQATGNPLPEWLESEAGQKWLAWCEQRTAV